MSPSSIHTWLREGQAPAYMELVCEALRQRHAHRRGLPAEPEADATLVVKVSRREQEVVQRFLDAVHARAYEIA